MQVAVNGLIDPKLKGSLAENLSQDPLNTTRRMDPSYQVEREHLRSIQQALTSLNDLTFTIKREGLRHIGTLTGSRLMRIPKSVHEEVQKSGLIQSWRSPHTGHCYSVRYEKECLYVRPLDESIEDPFRVRINLQAEGSQLNPIFGYLVQEYSKI